MDQVKPPLVVKRIGFKKLQFGDAPVRIEAVRMDRTRPKSEIFLELDFRWAGDANIVLAIDPAVGGCAAIIMRYPYNAMFFRSSFGGRATSTLCSQLIPLSEGALPLVYSLCCSGRVSLGGRRQHCLRSIPLLQDTLPLQCNVFQVGLIFGFGWAGDADIVRSTLLAEDALLLNGNVK